MWCQHMGAGVSVCTWKRHGQQGKFVSGDDVASACFGHMVVVFCTLSAAHVRLHPRDGTAQVNSDDLKQVFN